jgi:uncharacterized oxidoreductase
MLSILMDPQKFHVAGESFFADDMRRFIDFVKGAEKAASHSEILVPGDVERRQRADRLANGIELDAKTWSQIEATAQSLGVPGNLIDQVQGPIPGAAP